jgi:hypothetical protein
MFDDLVRPGNLGKAARTPCDRCVTPQRSSASQILKGAQEGNRAGSRPQLGQSASFLSVVSVYRLLSWFRTARSSLNINVHRLFPSPSCIALHHTLQTANTRTTHTRLNTSVNASRSMPTVKWLSDSLHPVHSRPASHLDRRCNFFGSRARRAPPAVPGQTRQPADGQVSVP